VALSVLRARMLHAVPPLRTDARVDEAAPAATATISKRAALEAKLAHWQDEAEKLHKETEEARRAWLKSPADLALKEAHLAAKDALASAKQERDSVLKQLEMLGGCLPARKGGKPALTRAPRGRPRPGGAFGGPCLPAGCGTPELRRYDRADVAVAQRSPS
jgi:hypothetical protein